MPDIKRLGIGAIIFLIGAIIYIVHLVLSLLKRSSRLPLDGVGLMVLGIGLSLLLKW